MELFYFQQESELDNFIKNAPLGRGGEFLQSWSWGEILRREGEEILRLGVRDARGEIVAAATVIKKSAGGIWERLSGKTTFYWYAPGGPVGAPVAAEFLIAALKKLDQRALFFRLEPRLAQERFLRLEAPVGTEFKKTLDLQPRQTLILNLSLSAAELLAGMHQKTRYNIRLAEKKGVKIKEGDAADAQEFWRLLSLTGERDDFRLHNFKHYRNLLATEGGFIKLFFAVYQGKNIAAALVCFFGNQAIYLHGASDNEFRNVMAPYLLQWTLIEKAQSAACHYYDFYGIDEKKWPGVTRFKLGFGGERVIYPGTYDFVFKAGAYRLYNFLRRLRRLIG